MRYGVKGRHSLESLCGEYYTGSAMMYAGTHISDLKINYKDSSNKYP